VKEYIDRKAAEQAKPEFLNEKVEGYEKAIYAKGWNDCNTQYRENILSIPAADVVEKNHNFIDGANLASKIAGHSYYHGDAILSAIFTLMNGKDGIASIKPADEIKFFYADWLWDGYDYEKPWFCSKCRCHSENGTNYCPNCGAKMNGGIKNDDNI
jgi:hypothetical protein